MENPAQLRVQYFFAPPNRFPPCSAPIPNLSRRQLCPEQLLIGPPDRFICYSPIKSAPRPIVAAANGGRYRRERAEESARNASAVSYAPRNHDFPREGLVFQRTSLEQACKRARRARPRISKLDSVLNAAQPRRVLVFRSKYRRLDELGYRWSYGR